MQSDEEVGKVAQAVPIIIYILFKTEMKISFFPIIFFKYFRSAPQLCFVFSLTVQILWAFWSNSYFFPLFT